MFYLFLINSSLSITFHVSLKLMYIMRVVPRNLENGSKEIYVGLKIINSWFIYEAFINSS